MNHEKCLLYTLCGYSLSHVQLFATLCTVTVATRLRYLCDSPGNKTRVVAIPISRDKYSIAVHKQKLISEAFENKGKDSSYPSIEFWHTLKSLNIFFLRIKQEF